MKKFRKIVVVPGESLAFGDGREDEAPEGYEFVSSQVIGIRYENGAGQVQIVPELFITWGQE